MPKDIQKNVSNISKERSPDTNPIFEILVGNNKHIFFYVNNQQALVNRKRAPMIMVVEPISKDYLTCKLD